MTPQRHHWNESRGIELFQSACPRMKSAEYLNSAGMGKSCAELKSGFNCCGLLSKPRTHCGNQCVARTAPFDRGETIVHPAPGAANCEQATSFQTAEIFAAQGHRQAKSFGKI